MTGQLPPERLYLVGFMGAGKSTVGRNLSDRLGWPYRDLDDIIESETGKSIPEIFEMSEERFRELETKYLIRESEKPPPFVLATGGGVVVREKNRDVLKRTGTAIYLNVDFDVIYARIKFGEGRPLVPDGDDAYRKLKSLWDDRQEYYSAVGSTLPLGDESPEIVTEMILDELSQTTS